MEKILSPARLPFEGLILVCRKCTKRLGKEGKSLRKKLKAGARERFGKKGMRLVSTGCFDLCPRGSVTVGVTGKDRPLRLTLLAPTATADEAFVALGLNADLAR